MNKCSLDIQRDFEAPHTPFGKRIWCGMKPLLVLIVGCLMLSSCHVHRITRTYFDFTHLNNIEIVEYGYLTDEHTNYYYQEKVPFKYYYFGEGVNLRIEIDDGGSPYVYLFIESLNPDLTIRENGEKIGAPENSGCLGGRYEKDTSRKDMIAVLWYRSEKNNCLVSLPSQLPQIELLILDAESNIVSEEIIPFQIKVASKGYMMDSL